MICLLLGHNQTRVDGAGPKEGRFAVLCERCGKIFEEGGELTPVARGYRDFETAPVMGAIVGRIGRKA